MVDMQACEALYDLKAESFGRGLSAVGAWTKVEVAELGSYRL